MKILDLNISDLNTRTIPPTSKLAKHGYIHYFVNHKYELSSLTCKHLNTNNIESLWGRLKKFIRKI